MNIKSGGLLFLNGDDKYLIELKDEINKDIRIITFGKGHENDYRIEKIVCEGFESRFIVLKKDQELGVFELSIPGVHNAFNSLSVIAFLHEIGFEASEIRAAIKSFKGSKRRLELIGKTDKGAILIDDYGHHPLEISTTLSAIKKAYPEKDIICVFQSHTYSRTKSLLSDFAKSFDEATYLCLLPIFKSQRDTESDIFPEKDFVNAFGEKKNVKFIENFSDMVKYIRENYDSSDKVIVTIGAGEVYKISYELAQK